VSLRPVRAGLASLLVAAAACTSSPGQPSGVTNSIGSPPAATSTTTGGGNGRVLRFTLPPPKTGRESSTAVRRRLCVRPPAPKPTPAQPARPPPAIVQAEQEVQQVRELRYVHPVAVEPVTHQQLVNGLDTSFDHSYPVGLMGRRSLAWQSIGVLPKGSGLRADIHSYLSGQVIGYYDPSSGQLVFIGSDNPSPVERLTLAHELTHADDDQHFDLNRLNGLENACADERMIAALGAVEGSAVYFSFQVAQTFFSPGDLAKLAFGGGGGPPGGVPPFVQALETWPYIDGPGFIRTLRTTRGIDGVNAALRRFPETTEQVIHPEKFPGDRPVAVEVPDLGPALGAGWRDLDVMDVGEEWLRAMLGLRLDTAAAASAAAGWGGAQYRAFTDGTHVAVALVTAWDTPRDATEFLVALRRWMEPGQAAVAGRTTDPTRVVGLFASDRGTLASLEKALA
jgi:hypothetical protein